MPLPNAILRAVTRLGSDVAKRVDQGAAQLVNDVLDEAARRVADIDLYDGYDQSTRDAAVERIRDLKLEIFGEGN